MPFGTINGVTYEFVSPTPRRIDRVLGEVAPAFSIGLRTSVSGVKYAWPLEIARGTATVAALQALQALHGTVVVWNGDIVGNVATNCILEAADLTYAAVSGATTFDGGFQLTLRQV